MARLLSLPTSGQNAEVVKARALQLSQEILFIAPVGKGEGLCGEIGGRAGGGASVHCCAVCAPHRGTRSGGCAGLKPRVGPQL